MDLRRALWRPLFNRVYRSYVLRRIAAPSQARFLGHRLATDPEVFHPVYFLSSRILAETVLGLGLAGKRFLDMGTGSGPVAVVAAAAGAQVTACDLNPRAVALARENLRRNGLPGATVESDLFAALPEGTFDVIAFNLPFYPRQPRTPFELAFFAGEDFATVRAFAAGCPRRLAPGGTVAVVFSEDSGRDRVVGIFAAAGLTVVGERVTRKFFEEFHAVCFRDASGGPPSGEARPAPAHRS
jgi:release factor glutamine methyltransferase